MRKEEISLNDACILYPEIYNDGRGYFFESYNQQAINNLGISFNPVQDNESFSKAGTIRGLHFQKDEYSQAKLIRVIEGKIKEVIVDLRKQSTTYLSIFSIIIDSDEKQQLFIPKGFAHGFSVLSETAIVSYKCDNYYNPNAEGGVNCLDKQLGIDWGIPLEKIIMSEKDKNLPGINELKYFF